MKKKILLLCLPVIFMLPAKILSQASPHDSLLFDGNSGNLFYQSSCVCTVKVIKCDGEAHGYRLHKEINELCGQKDTSYTVINSILTEGDELMTGDKYDIYTEDGKLKIQLENGLIIHFAEKTKIALDIDYCCKKNWGYTLKKGTICFESKGYKGTDMTCKSRYGLLVDFLTLYTVDVTGDADILKVYEGTVKSRLLKPDMTEHDKLGEQMRQLTIDVQEGRITVDEFKKKAKEYSDRIKYINEHMTPVNVDSGNKCTITTSSLTVEPIESSDERWWEK